jgi:hypothetical protein
MLAWLEDVIFEGLPNRLAKTWPERFLSSIAPGQDLSRIGWRLLYWLMTDSRFADPDYPIAGDAARRCADLLRRMIEGQSVDPAAAEDTARMAWIAAKKAAPESERAVWLAEAAARAAESVALTADGTASAERAATSVSALIARSADYITVSEKLLALLAAAGGAQVLDELNPPPSSSRFCPTM